MGHGRWRADLASRHADCLATHALATKKLDHLLTTAESQARAIISTHRDTVEALSQDLLDTHEMTGEVLEAWIVRIRDLAATTAQTKPREGVIPFDPG